MIPIRIVLILAIATLSASPSSAAEKMRLLLRSKAVVDHDLVTVQDVASVLGGTDAQRRKVLRLDLEDLQDHESQETQLIAEEVRIRILLSGFDPGQFDLSGAPAVAVVRDRSKEHMEKIVEEISQEIAASTDLPREDILLRVTSSLDSRLTSGSAGKLEFRLPVDGKQALGRRQVRMGAYQNGQLLKFFDVMIDSQIVLEAPVATTKIQKGEPLAAESVSFQRKQFSQWPTELLTRETLPGKLAAVDIRAGQEIGTRLIQSKSKTSEIKKLAAMIKVRDPVIVIAEVGNVKIALNNAIALSSGTAGDLIRVRNESTKKVLTCRVINSRQVQVVY